MSLEESAQEGVHKGGANNIPFRETIFPEEGKAEQGGQEVRRAKIGTFQTRRGKGVIIVNSERFGFCGGGGGNFMGFCHFVGFSGEFSPPVHRCGGPAGSKGEEKQAVITRGQRGTCNSPKT